MTALTGINERSGTAWNQPVEKQKRKRKKNWIPSDTSNALPATIADEIQKFTGKYETRLDHRVSPMAIQSLDSPEDIKRLKRRLG